MGQKRTRAQRPLRSTPRHCTATRSRFVSYSGLGRPKPKANQNSNTTRIPYRYTPQPKWSTFVTNGRPRLQKCCLLLCDVTFESSYCKPCRFWKESHSHQPGEHAEVKALRHISAKEQEAGTVARVVALYLSYSPCASCADVIIDFSRSRPLCQMSVRFSCVYRHKKVRHRDGLRRLNAVPRVVVGVFTNLEWMCVAKATGISFHYNVPTRQTWDLIWTARFENILQEQHYSRRNNATSSGLSGYFSSMWWQSRDEHQEGLLDAVNGEAAEGDVAVTRSVTKRRVCYGILIVAIVVIVVIGARL